MPTQQTNRLISRRNFNTAIATSAILKSGTCSAQDQIESKTNWIDAHAHVWHPDTERYPISRNYKIEDMQPKSFTEKELISHCKPAGVNRIVLIQMSFYEYDHRYMEEVMRANPNRFSGVSLIDWNQRRLQAEVKKHRRAGMRGFRMHSRGDAGRWPSDANVRKLWSLAADYDLAICPLINPEDLEHIESLCKQFPKTKVVIDHFARIGVGGQIDEDRIQLLCRLANHPQTHVKTSAFYALGKGKPPYLDLLPMIQRIVSAYGAERLMWASDCPYQVQAPHTYQDSLDLINKHANFLSTDDKTAILSSTAEKIFF